jgi:hypothetical protein
MPATKPRQPESRKSLSETRPCSDPWPRCVFDDPGKADMSALIHLPHRTVTGDPRLKTLGRAKITDDQTGR